MLVLLTGMTPVPSARNTTAGAEGDIAATGNATANGPVRAAARTREDRFG